MALKANPGNWFEIPTNDLSRAQVFYEYILETQLTPNEMAGTKMAMFPMEQGGSGSGGSLIKAQGHTPSSSGTLIYLGVEDINAVVKRITEKGGKVLLPKESIGEYGFIALFEDTEGNRIGLHSMK